LSHLLQKNGKQDCNNKTYQVQIGNKTAYEQENKTNPILTAQFQTLDIAMIGFFEEFFFGKELTLQINNMMKNDRLLFIVVTRKEKYLQGRRSN
jgi:hypothetical protein